MILIFYRLVLKGIFLGLKIRGTCALNKSLKLRASEFSQYCDELPNESILGNAENPEARGRNVPDKPASFRLFSGKR